MPLKNTFYNLLLITSIATVTPIFGNEPSSDLTHVQTAENHDPVDIQKISQAFGHLIKKNLESLGFDFDLQQVIQGIEDSVSGKTPPMDESTCVQAISLVQEQAFQQESDLNIEKANTFMEKNAKEKNVLEIEKHKIQYTIEQQGHGAVVESHCSPLLRYTGKFLDGTVFGASKENELITLDETIPGFSAGIVGMKEGEKRTLYIHPDRGYGTSSYLPPNSTLIFNIELVEANPSIEEHSETDQQEVAIPDITPSPQPIR